MATVGVEAAPVIVAPAEIELSMGSKKNIILFPYMAQGHLIPFLTLANLLHRRDHDLTITIVNTPLNIQKLRSILPPDSPILLHALPFTPADHGLPPDGENHDDLPPPHIFRLFHVSQTLRLDFHALLASMAEKHGRPPLCVIADFLLGWTVEVARNLGVFHATFNTSGAFGIACYLSLWLHLPHWKNSSPEFHLPGFPEDFRLHRSQVPAFMDPSAPEYVVSCSQKQFTLSCIETDGILCNTVEELEVFGLEMLRKITGRRVWPVGPLNSLQRNSGKKLGIEVDACLRWLDTHPPGSVIYVSFGSHETISASQLMALAAGLEASGVPFVWVVRPPAGFDVKGEFKAEWLPEEFEARMTKTGRGLLVKKWAPQLAVLGHESTGAFLSHCGWNSVIESLSLGVPIVGWPLSMEQFYNSKMVEEELGVGIEVARGAADEVESDRIAAAIKLVVAEEKGKEMKKKAMEFRGKISAAAMIRGPEGEEDMGCSSIEALDEFIGTITKLEGGGQ